LAGQLSELERVPGELLPGHEIPVQHRPRRDPDLYDPVQRRLSKSRCERLLPVLHDLCPREVACLEGPMQEEEVGPELECPILRGLRTRQQIVCQVRSLGDHVGTPQAVGGVLQYACPDSRIADVTCERDRFLGKRLATDPVVLVEQLLRLQREQLGAPARVGAVVE
jgi:hypothetical protein